MMKSKIKLPNTKEKHDLTWAFNENISCAAITSSLPYYKSRRSEYVHIVRSGLVHYIDNKFDGACMSFWCGGHGFPGKKGTLLSDNGESPFCATCMGKAVGAGVFGKRIINGKPVLYQPRPE